MFLGLSGPSCSYRKPVSWTHEAKGKMEVELEKLGPLCGRPVFGLPLGEPLLAIVWGWQFEPPGARQFDLAVEIDAQAPRELQPEGSVVPLV